MSRVAIGMIHRGIGQVTLISEGQTCPAGTYATQQPTGDQQGICMQAYCYPLPNLPCPPGSVLPPASGPDASDPNTWDPTGPLTVQTLTPPTAVAPKPTPVPASTSVVPQTAISTVASTPVVDMSTVPVTAPVPAPAFPSITSDFSWLTESSFDSIPNWALLAGGAVLLFIILGRKR
jgi:hypothetical protein